MTTSRLTSWALILMELIMWPLKMVPRTILMLSTSSMRVLVTTAPLEMLWTIQTSKREQRVDVRDGTKATMTPTLMA